MIRENKPETMLADLFEKLSATEFENGGFVRQKKVVESILKKGDRVRYIVPEELRGKVKGGAEGTLESDPFIEGDLEMVQIRHDGADEIATALVKDLEPIQQVAAESVQTGRTRHCLRCNKLIVGKGVVAGRDVYCSEKCAELGPIDESKKKVKESHQERFESEDGSIRMIVNHWGGGTSGYVELIKDGKIDQTIKFDNTHDANYKHYIQKVKRVTEKVNEDENKLKEFSVTDELADQIAAELGIDFEIVNKDEFKKGLEVEQEHADITEGDPTMTARIVMAHLNELPDYYTRLLKMEDDAKKEQTPAEGAPSESRVKNFVLQINKAERTFKIEEIALHPDKAGLCVFKTKEEAEAVGRGWQSGIKESTDDLSKLQAYRDFVKKAEEILPYIDNQETKDQMAFALEKLNKDIKESKDGVALAGSIDAVLMMWNNLKIGEKFPENLKTELEAAIKRYNETVQLPTVEWDGKTYFIDQRLKELRNTQDPSDSLTFADIDDPAYEELITKLLDMGIELVEKKTNEQDAAKLTVVASDVADETEAKKIQAGKPGSTIMQDPKTKRWSVVMKEAKGNERFGEFSFPVYEFGIELFGNKWEKKHEPDEVFKELETPKGKAIAKKWLEQEIKTVKAKGVKVVDVEFNECDSGNYTHAGAYFHVTLSGPDDQLAKVMGEDKIVFASEGEHA